MLRLAMIAVALASGGGAGLIGYRATLQSPVETAPPIAEVDVLTLNRDLLRGARLAEAHLDWSPWRADKVRPGMILRSGEPDARSRLAGRAVRSNLYAGEAIRAQHLAEGDGGYLALTLAPSMRAIGVQVNEVKTAGGFIMPNDRVDVLLTVVRDLDGDGAATGATRTILTNLRVLAIGDTTYEAASRVGEAPGDGSKKAADRPLTVEGKTATLEVTPAQAEILLAATASGHLSLALRAAEDFGLSGIGDLEMIERAVEPAEPAVSPPDPRAPRKRQVTIISSGSTRVVVAEWGGQAGE